MNTHHYHIAMAIMGTAIFIIVACVAILVGSVAHGRCIEWREKRAIAKRDASEAKRRADLAKWSILFFPPEQRRIPRSQLDPAIRTGQFRIPSAFRDMKGIYKL